MSDTYLGPAMPMSPGVLAQRVPPPEPLGPPMPDEPVAAAPPRSPFLMNQETELDRLGKLLKLREDAFEMGLRDDMKRWVQPPVEDPKERRTMALRAFSGYLAANPDQHDAVRKYISGETDFIPEGWELSRAPLPSAELHIARSIREQQGPVVSTAMDLLRAGGAVLPARIQTGLDLTFALPRLFGANVHAPNVEAEMHRLFQPAPGKGGAFGHYDRAALAEAAYWASPIEARGLVDVARFVGGMQGLGIGVTKSSSFVDKAISAPGRLTLGTGAFLGGTAGRAGAAAMKASPELRAIAETYGAGAGAFGLLEYMLAHDDKGQPKVGGMFSLDRLEALGWGLAGGAALTKLNQSAAQSFKGMLETKWAKLGKTEQDAINAMRDWGVKNFRAPYKNEVLTGPHGYTSKLSDAWFNAGAEGMPAIPMRKLFAYGRRGIQEMPGYSLLDEQFREDLFTKAFNPKLSQEERIEAAKNVLYKMVVNSVGAGTLHALHMPLADLPGMQRARQTQRPARATQPSTSVQGGELPQLPELPPGEGRGGSSQQVVEPPKVTHQERITYTGAREYAENEATRVPEPQEPMPEQAPPGVRYLPGADPNVLNRPKQEQVPIAGPEPAPVDPAADLVRQGWRPPIWPQMELPKELTNLQSPLERAGYDLVRNKDGIVTIRHRQTGEVRTLNEKEFYDEFGRHKEAEAEPEEVHFQKDDTRREFMAQQAREFPEGEISVQVGSNVASLALRFFPQKSRAYQDLRAAAEANGGAVRFTKEEARRFIDYHSRSAPRRRQAKTGDVGVEQSNIQALDSLMEKMVDAFGLAKEPPKGEKREGAPPGPGQPEGEPYRGDITREPQKYDPEPPARPRHPRESERGSADPFGAMREIAKEIREGVRELMLDGTEHRIIISSDGKEAKASPKLEKLLGIEGPLPVEVMLDQVAWMGRLSALRAMTDLPGTRIDASQVFAVPGRGDDPPKAYTIRMGELVQADLVPGELKWSTPKKPIPARGADVIDEPQRQVADALTEILNTRTDLPPHVGKELDAIISVLRKVNGTNDEGVFETMQMMPDILRGLASGDARHAERLIQATSEMLTTKTPDVAIADMAREQLPKTEMDFAVQAMMNADPTMTREKARAHLEDTMRTVEGDEILRRELFQSTQTRTDPYSGKQVPVRESPGESGMARIPTEEEVKEVVYRTKAAASDAASVPAKFARGYYQGTIERVEAEGERDIAQNIGWAGVTKSKEIASRYSTTGRLMDLRRGGHERRKVIDSLEELSPRDEHGGYATLNQRAMDKASAQHWGEAILNEGQREVVEIEKALLKETQDVAEEIGIQQTDPSGKNPRPFKAGAEVLVREYAPEMHTEMLKKAGPRYDALMNWISKTYSQPRQEVERHFSDARSLTQLDATEIRRVYPYLPSHLDIAGFSKPVRIFETRALEHAEALAKRSANIMGARSVMPRFPEAKEGAETLGTPAGLEPLPKTAQQLVDSVLNSGKPNARAAAEAVADMVRAMHGLPLFRERWMIRPGEKGYDVVRIGKALLGPIKAGKLTMAFARNVFEAVANAPYFGMGSLGRGVKTVVESIADGSFAERHRQAVEEGFVADTKINSPWKGDRPIETFEAMMKKVGEVLTSMLRGTQDFNELVFTEAARERLTEMQEGNGTHADFSALKKLGFSNAEAQAMMRGEGTPEQYDRYRRNIIGQLAGGKSKSSAERSLVAHSATMRSLLWFQDFFQARTAALAQLGKDIREAETAEERAMAGAKMLQFAAMTTLSGALGTTFVKLISGSDDMVNYLRESTAQDSLDMGKDLLGLFISGVLGGLGQPIAEGFEAIADPGTTLKKGGNAMVRALGPVGIGLEFADFVRALTGVDVPGYENMSPLEKTARYLRSSAPAGKALHEGLFGLSAIAITEKDPQLDAAQDSYYRWRRDHKPFDESARREEDRATRDAMRNVIDQVAAGKRWGDKDLEAAIINALAAKQDKGGERPFSMQEARTFVANSLEARRNLPQPGERDWTKPQREKLLAHLGDQNVQILRDYDLILTQLAHHIRPMSTR